jgi:hypothetical protein
VGADRKEGGKEGGVRTFELLKEAGEEVGDEGRGELPRGEFPAEDYLNDLEDSRAGQGGQGG